MKPLTIVLTIIASMIIDTNEQPTEDQNKILFDNAKGFELNKNSLNFKAFIEDKLIEHTQALELLVNKLQKQEDIIKKLVDNLSNKIAPPKMPEKVKINYTRRSNNEEQVKETPIIKFGENVTKFGILFKDIVMQGVKTSKEPIAIIEVEELT